MIQKNDNISLRPLCSTDWELVYELYNNEAVSETALLSYIYPLSDKSIKEKVEGWLNSVFQKHFVVSVEDKDIGMAQIYNICYMNGKCNIGILFNQDYWGQGYGSKVIRELINICFKKINLHRIEVEVLSSNEKSISLIKKIGFIKEGVLKEAVNRDGKYYDILLYGLLNKK